MTEFAAAAPPHSPTRTHVAFAYSVNMSSRSVICALGASALMATLTTSFQTPISVPRAPTRLHALTTRQRPNVVAMTSDEHSQSFFDPTGLSETPLELGHAAPDSGVSPALANVAGLAALAAFASPDAALAKGGEFGPFEGKVIALIHPAVMATVFLTSLGAGYTGLQWRRTRTIGQDIQGMKSTLKAGPKAALAGLAAEDGTFPDSPRVSALQAEIATAEASIAELSAERKTLASADYRDRHWAFGSIILALGVSFAIEGPVNTFMRAGKLFPGPHVYAGCACVVGWALAAALVPQMQKGADWARSCHIAFNSLATALFTWQIVTGFGITQKVIEKGAYWISPGF